MSQEVIEIKSKSGLYLDEVKAQALELMQRGFSARATADRLGLVYRTVARWALRWREVDANTDLPLLLEDWTRIVYRAQQGMHDYLDYLDEHPEELKKAAVPLNIYAGTGTDKLLKSREGPSHANITVNIVTEHPPGSQPDIEAEFTEVEE